MHSLCTSNTCSGMYCKIAISGTQLNLSFTDTTCESQIHLASFKQWRTESHLGLKVWVKTKGKYCAKPLQAYRLTYCKWYNLTFKLGQYSSDLIVLQDLVECPQ